MSKGEHGRRAPRNYFANFPATLRVRLADRCLSRSHSSVLNPAARPGVSSDFLKPNEIDEIPG